MRLFCLFVARNPYPTWHVYIMVYIHHGILTQPARGGSVVFRSTGPRDSIGDWCVFFPIRNSSAFKCMFNYDIEVRAGPNTRVPGPSSRARGSGVARTVESRARPRCRDGTTTTVHRPPRPRCMLHRMMDTILDSQESVFQSHAHTAARRVTRRGRSSCRLHARHCTPLSSILT